MLRSVVCGLKIICCDILANRPDVVGLEFAVFTTFVIIGPLLTATIEAT
jgi:hypothetical protein